MITTGTTRPFQQVDEGARREVIVDRSRFRVARDSNEVLNAWRMVYEVYVKAGLIHENPYRIHTTPQTLSPGSAVFHSLRNDAVESTLTAIVDSPEAGLPMDLVYQSEIDGLRRKGRVTEYGLFAHVRQLTSPSEANPHLAPRKQAPARPLGRVHCSVMQLMRLAFHFTRKHDSSEFIVGVHPRHAPFYLRAFGFRQLGKMRTCPSVNHRPVVLLHANLRQVLRMRPLPYVLDYCLRRPVDAEAFDRRFSPADLRDAELDAYLEDKYRTLRRCAG